MMRLERIVVVGNGVAGLTAGDSLRAAGFDGELTIVGDEHHARTVVPPCRRLPSWTQKR